MLKVLDNCVLVASIWMEVASHKSSLVRRVSLIMVGLYFRLSHITSCCFSYRQNKLLFFLSEQIYLLIFAARNITLYV